VLDAPLLVRLIGELPELPAFRLVVNDGSVAPIRPGITSPSGGCVSPGVMEHGPHDDRSSAALRSKW
jgi:hypothetical protein